MRAYMDGVGLLTALNGEYAVEKDSGAIAKFLNRILGLPVNAQNALFSYFMDTHRELVAQAKRDGVYDLGILGASRMCVSVFICADLGTAGDTVHLYSTRTFAANEFTVYLYTVRVERGVSWPDALDAYNARAGDSEHNGFYASQAINGRATAALVYSVGKKRLETGARLYCVTRPNTGRNVGRLETIEELLKRLKPIPLDTAERLWTHQYTNSSTLCMHAYLHNVCRMGGVCDQGRRSRQYCVLAGSVLSVWPEVEDVLAERGARRPARMQVIRVRTEMDTKIVGLLVPQRCHNELVNKLETKMGARSTVEIHTTPC